MKLLILLIMLTGLNKEVMLFDFNKNGNITRWYRVNDNVMGGISNSNLVLDENGNGVFKGEVSLENNGGFAMVCLPLDVTIADHHKKVVLFIRGDGKKYQLRLKSKIGQNYWYIAPFQTSQELQQIEIPLVAFYPSFRGRKLKLDNFSSNTLKEMAILIGNKKSETFELTIDKIIIR